MAPIRSITELQKLFNDALKQQNFSGDPKELYEPFDYILGLGGKRLRPVLLLMACELFGKNAADALPQAIAIELFHNFTLIPDDIMDQAPLRRGLPAVHEKYNSSVAILSGDAMLVYTYHYLVQVENHLLVPLISLFNDCAMKVCEGQQTDMNFETRSEITADEYLRMIELKTATLVATSLKIGAMIGGASSADADHLYHFGLQLGIAFQLKDDWLDSFGDAAKVGKQAGGDIIQNKKTFLLIEAMNIADENSKRELLNYYSEQNTDPKLKVKHVLEIFTRLGIDVIAEKEMQKHFDEALTHLDAINLPAERKIQMRDLAKELMAREK